MKKAKANAKTNHSQLMENLEPRLLLDGNPNLWPLNLPDENMADLPVMEPSIVTAGGQRLLLNYFNNNGQTPLDDVKVAFDATIGQLITNRPGWWVINYPLDQIQGLPNVDNHPVGMTSDQIKDLVASTLFGSDKTAEDVKNWYVMTPVDADHPLATEPGEPTGPAPITATDLSNAYVLVVDSDTNHTSPTTDPWVVGRLAAATGETVDGTIYRTIQSALDRIYNLGSTYFNSTTNSVNQKTVVLVAPGTYRERVYDNHANGTADFPLIFEGIPDANGQMPIISGATVFGSWSADPLTTVGDVNVSGQNLYSSPIPTTTDDGGGSPRQRIGTLASNGQIFTLRSNPAYLDEGEAAYNYGSTEYLNMHGMPEDGTVTTAPNFDPQNYVNVATDGDGYLDLGNQFLAAPSNPLAYWALNGNGACSNGNLVTTVGGTPSWTSGQAAQGMAFNGSTNYLTTTDTTNALNIGAGDFTVSAWIKLPDAGMPSSSTYTIMQYGMSATLGGFSVTISKDGSDPNGWPGSNSTVAFSIGTSGSPVTLTSSNMNKASTAKASSGWHLVTLVRSSGNGTIYWDGIQIGTRTGMTSSIAGNQTLTVGCNGALGAKFAGEMDEVRIYQRALDATERTNLKPGVNNVVWVDTWVWVPAPAGCGYLNNNRVSFSTNSYDSARTYGPFRAIPFACNPVDNQANPYRMWINGDAAGQIWNTEGDREQELAHPDTRSFCPFASASDPIEDVWNSFDLTLGWNHLVFQLDTSVAARYASTAGTTSPNGMKYFQQALKFKFRLGACNYEASGVHSQSNQPSQYDIDNNVAPATPVLARNISNYRILGAVSASTADNQIYARPSESQATDKDPANAVTELANRIGAFGTEWNNGHGNYIQLRGFDCQYGGVYMAGVGCLMEGNYVRDSLFGFNNNRDVGHAFLNGSFNIPFSYDPAYANYIEIPGGPTLNLVAGDVIAPICLSGETGPAMPAPLLGNHSYFVGAKDGATNRWRVYDNKADAVAGNSNYIVLTRATTGSSTLLLARHNTQDEPTVLLNNWTTNTYWGDNCNVCTFFDDVNTNTVNEEGILDLPGHVRTFFLYNRIVNANAKGAWYGWDWAAMGKGFGSVQNVYAYNYFDGGTGLGVWLDTAGLNCRFEGNMFMGIDNATINVEASPGPSLIANNIIVSVAGNYGSTLASWSSNRDWVMNNTIMSGEGPSACMNTSENVQRYSAWNDPYAASGTSVWFNQIDARQAFVNNLFLDIAHATSADLNAATPDVVVGNYTDNAADLTVHPFYTVGQDATSHYIPRASMGLMGAEDHDFRLTTSSPLNTLGIDDVLAWNRQEWDGDSWEDTYVNISDLVTHDFFGLPRLSEDGTSVGATRAAHTYTSTGLEVEFTDGTIQRMEDWNGLVARWKLNETGGTTAANSGNGDSLDGTLGAGVTWDEGYVGTGAEFHRTSTDQISVTQNTSNAIEIGTGPFTLSAWIRLDQSVTLNNQDYVSYPILSNGTLYQDSPTFNLDVYGGGFNGLYFLVGNQHVAQYHGDPSAVSGICANRINVNSTLSDHQWHLVTATRDATGLGLLYLDGVEVGRGTGMTQAVTTPVSPTNILIGQGDWSQTFNGNLDDVRIYTRVLSQTEIVQMHAVASVSATATDDQATGMGNGGAVTVTRTPTPVSRINQIGWWKFDETTGQTAVNYSPVGAGLNATFQNTTITFGTGYTCNVIAAGDLNDDGKMDLVETNIAPNTVTVHLGNGDGTFQTGVAYATPRYPGGVTLGDFDGDDDLDIAVTAMADYAMSVFLNNGNGTFGNRADYGLPTGATSVIAGDFDRDGDLDLATANYYNSTMSVFSNNGSGTFSGRTDYNTGTSPVTVDVADFNGDGRLDLVTANLGTNNVSVFLGNGNGTFQSKADYSAGTSPYQAVTGDFNEDGHPDLAVANGGGGNFSYLENNGNGTFASPVNFTTGATPYSIAVADLNGDGHLDVVTADASEDTVSVLLGDGDGGFSARTTYATGDEPTTVIVTDVYGRGTRDIATCNYYATISVVTPPWNAGHTDNAVTLTQANQQSFSVPSDSAFNFGTGAFTLSAWIKYAGTTIDDLYPIIQRGAGQTGADWALALDPWDNGLALYMDDYGYWLYPTYDQSATLTDHNWHLVTVTRDASGVSAMYIDGRTVACNTTALQGVEGDGTGDAPVTIGRQSEYGINSFPGSIDDVMVFTRALTPAEVAAMSDDFDTPLTVRYSTSGSATNGVDYASLSGVVTIPAGERTATVTVQPIDSAYGVGKSATISLASADDAAAQYRLGGTTSDAVAVGNADLAAWWKLDQTSGTTFPDSSGNGLTGTFASSGTWGAGQLNNGVTFNSQYATSAQPNMGNGNDPFTVSIWYKLPDSVTQLDTANTFFSGLLSNTPRGNDYGFQLGIVCTDYYKGIFFEVGKFGVNANEMPLQTDVRQLLLDHQWHLITAVRDATGGHVYFDGVNVGNSGGGFQAPAGNSTQSMRIGASVWYSGTGSFDDARIYNRVLTTAEMLAMRNYSTVTIAATDNHGTQLGDTGTFTVTRTGPTTEPLTVSYNVSGGYTNNGTAYVQLPGTVTIPAGQSSATIKVTPIDAGIGAGGAVVLTLTQNADSAYYLSNEPIAATVNLDNANFPLANWKFEEGSGTTTANSGSGTDLTATLANSPTWGSGQSGKGLTFNGTNQYAYVPYSASMGSQLSFGTGGFTVSAMYKLPMTDTFTNVSYPLISMGSSATSLITLYLANNDSTHYEWTLGMDFVISGAGKWSYFCPLPDISNVNRDHQWHMLTVTRDAENSGRLYLDGSPLMINLGGGQGRVLELNMSQVVYDLQNGSGNLYIGVIGGGGSYFKGSMDNVQIYNRGLSVSEVAALAANLLADQNSAPTFTDVATGSVTVNWVAKSGATNYLVDRSTDPAFGTYTRFDTGSTNLGYTDNTVTDGTTYYYRVYAVGPNSFSPANSVTTVLTAPTAISVDLVTTNRVELSWTYSGTHNTGFYIERSTDPGFYYWTTQTLTSASTATSYIDTTAFPQTKYYYRVRAFNTVAVSDGGQISTSVTLATNQVGTVLTENWYGTSGAWSSQWSYLNQLTGGTATLNLYQNQGQATFGTGCAGKYVAYVNTANIVDSDQRVQFTKVLGGSSSVSLIARDNTSVDSYYFAKAYINGASGTLTINKHTSSGDTQLATLNMTLNSYSTYVLRFQVLTNGATTNLNVNAWDSSSAEPTSWMLSTTDSSFQGVNGRVGVRLDPVDGGTGAVLVLDNYQATDASVTYLNTFQSDTVGQPAAGWAVGAGTWSVASSANSNRYYLSSNPGGVSNRLGAYTTINSIANVGDFVFTCEAAATSASGDFAVVFGYQNATNYYYMSFEGTSGLTKLFKVVNNTATAISTVSGTIVTDTNVHQIKIARSGRYISVWFDGQALIGNLLNDVFDGGKIGLGARTGTAYFDNVTVTVCTLDAPKGLGATAVSSSQINLTWSDPTSGNESGYQVWRAPDIGGNPGTFSLIYTTATGATGYNNSGLTDGTRYWYQVRSAAGNNLSPYSNQSSAITALIAPNTPTFSSVTAGGMTVSWTTGSAATTGYQVDRHNGSTWTNNVYVGSSTSFPDSGLSEGTTYTYRVRGTNYYTISADSTPNSQTTLLAAPTGVNFTGVTGSKIQVNWTDVSTHEYGYKLEWSPNGSTGWTQIGGALAAGTQSYLHTMLNYSTTYFYRVQAITSSSPTGDSAYATGNQATTTYTTLLTDGFETNFDKWTDGGATDWDRATTQKYSGSYSAHAGSADNDLTSDNLNTVGYSYIKIDFKYREDDLEAADAYLQLFNGSTYTNKADLNSATEDTWLTYSVTLNSATDAAYFISNFRIRFEGTPIDSGENLWIDDVLITAW